MGLKLPSFHPIQNLTSAIGGLVKDVVGSASSILNTPAGSAIAQGVVSKYTGGGGGGNAAPAAGIPAQVASEVANQGGAGKSSSGATAKPDGISVPFPDDWKRWLEFYQLTPDGYYLMDKDGKKQLDFMHIGILTVLTIGIIWAVKAMFFSKKGGGARRSSSKRSSRRRR
jgi:hypothetical protein